MANKKRTKEDYPNGTRFTPKDIEKFREVISEKVFDKNGVAGKNNIGIAKGTTYSDYLKATFNNDLWAYNSKLVIKYRIVTGNGYSLFEGDENELKKELFRKFDFAKKYNDERFKPQYVVKVTEEYITIDELGINGTE